METSPVTRACAACGHVFPQGAKICPQCGRDEANPFISPVAIQALGPRVGRRFVIGISAVVGVGVLLGWMAPGVGIAWAVLATPILVRTSAAISRRREGGLRVSWEDRFQAVLASTGVTLLAGLAASAAFVGACTVGMPLTVFDIGIYCAFGLGFAGAAAAGFFTMKRFWPRKIGNVGQ